MANPLIVPNKSYDSTAAAVFTNNDGQVVFVDQPFLKLMKYAQAETIVGEPLYKVLGLDPKAAKQMLDELLKLRLVRNQALDVSTAIGDKLKVLYTGIATYDPKGNFLGADVILRPFVPLDETVKETSTVTPIPPEPVISTVIEAAQMAIEAMPAPDNSFLELYFTEQVKALYVLLSRSVGLWVRDTIDKTINTEAQKKGSSVRIKGGIFTTPLSDEDVALYAVLLAKVQDYAVNVIGRGLVVKEIQHIDEQMHDGVIALADQAGLRTLFKK